MTMTSNAKSSARANKRRNTRQEIANVALQLFASHGFDSVSTTDIAQAVGVSQPNVLYYFKNKMGVWRAAVEELSERIRAASEDAVSPMILDQLDPLSGLKLLISALHKVSRRVPELGKMIHIESQSKGERLDWLVQKVVYPGYEVHLDLIEKCIEQKLLKPYPPHQILMMMHGAVTSYYNVAPMVEQIFGDDPNDRNNSNQFTELCLDAIFSGLQVQPD